MGYLQAILLGALQGIGEFLPISSSGHLLLAELLFGFDRTNPAYLLLDVLLHVGTLVPILIVFWDKWIGMLLHPVQNKNLWGMLILASVPALAVHVLGIDDGFENGWFLGCSFLITALFMLVTELYSRKHPGIEEVGYKNALIMGCFQGVALLPGVSRSGSTITGGVLSGLSRQAAASFSFMMCAPAIGGSLIFEMKDAIEEGYLSYLDPAPMLLGIIVSAVVGYIAIRFMLKLIQKISLGYFALYLAVIGLAYLVMQAVGAPMVPAFAFPAGGM